ncbi:MAG: transcriptional regulator [Chlorobaculum sp.]|nr:transcriptional regulator [Chlorobaculum sp.]
MGKQRFSSAAEAFASIVGDDTVKDAIQKAVGKTQLTDTLVRMRMQKGVSQKRLAELMQCTPSKISRLESSTDDTLKLSDIREYVRALNIDMSIVFENNDLPTADQIRQHVFSIHEKLESLVKIAKEVDGDSEIIGKINQFYGEVLLNFLVKFESSHSKLRMVVEPEKDDETEVSLENSKELVVTAE